MNSTIALQMERVTGDIRHDNLVVRRPWIARILGPDPEFRFQREFLRGKRDYSDADKKGRGIRVWYVLEPGYYEAFEPSARRFYLRATPNGGCGEVDRYEVAAWLRQKESA